METIQFDKATGTKECVSTVKQAGAVLLRGYVDLSLCERIVSETDERDMRLVDGKDTQVPRQFETLEERFPEDATPGTLCLGSRLIDFLHEDFAGWLPNSVAFNRYTPNQAGIGVHRDFFREKILIAVASLLGEAEFHIELDSKHGKKIWSQRTLQPGDLVLLRGPGLTGKDTDDRPRHSIKSPRRNHRISIAYRQTEKKPPEGGSHGNS